MDILVSSNLERLLYDMTGGNDALVASWMKSLNDAGVYTVNAEVKAKMVRTVLRRLLRRAGNQGGYQGNV